MPRPGNEPRQMRSHQAHKSDGANRHHAQRCQYRGSTKQQQAGPLQPDAQDAGSVVVDRQQIQPAPQPEHQLIRIEQRGLVDVVKVPSEKGPPRKVYSLTGPGQDCLNEFWRTWSFLSERLERIREEGNEHVG